MTPLMAYVHCQSVPEYQRRGLFDRVHFVKIHVSSANQHNGLDEEDQSLCRQLGWFIV